MPWKPYRTKCLLIAAVLLLVPGCAHREPIPRVFPPAADLKVQPKPQLKPEDVASEAALDAHDIALEAWGEAGWRQVARICRWAKANGMTIDCPT